MKGENKMLRYAGGKTRAIKILRPFVPETETEIVSPFLGGGSFELDLLARGKRVYGNDIVSPLVAFWTCMKTCREELMTRLFAELPPSKETYRRFQRTMTEGTQLDQAVKFFVVNRCCFSGCLTGGYSGTRFTRNSIEALADVDLSGLTIANTDYEAHLAMYPTQFAFLDPPYDVPNLYGSPEFNHERLAEVLRHRTSNWLLCYNDTPRIRQLYEGWTTIHPVCWTYGMNRSKTSNEILLLPKNNEVHAGTCL